MPRWGDLPVKVRGYAQSKGKRVSACPRVRRCTCPLLRKDFQCYDPYQVRPKPARRLGPMSILIHQLASVSDDRAIELKTPTHQWEDMETR